MEKSWVSARLQTSKDPSKKIQLELSFTGPAPGGHRSAYVIGRSLFCTIMVTHFRVRVLSRTCPSPVI